MGVLGNLRNLLKFGTGIIVTIDLETETMISLNIELTALKIFSGNSTY